MNGNTFLDTNILVFGYSFSELDRQRIAMTLIAEDNTFKPSLSTPEFHLSG